MRRADVAIADIPQPTGGHGWTLGSGELEPLWVDGPILPQLLADEVLGLESDDSDDDQLYEVSPIASDESECSDDD